MPAGFDDAPIINGLTQPVGVDWAANGRAFIVEKHGVLKTAAPGASTATTVLDIRSQVNDNGDRGLESVAVDKQFATNGFVYLAYVKELRPLVADSDSPMTSRLVRLRLNPATGQLANPAEVPVVLLGAEGDAPCPAVPDNTQDCMPADSTSHMIGTVRATADGTLWVGNGDGASFNFTDPLALRTLDPTSLAGKILHVDRDGNGLPGHAFCSANNDLTDVCTKVHAKGFRNPYRFQVRPDGKVILGDVGWNTREEIDVVDGPGKSHGWPCREGRIETPGYKDLAACDPYTTATETEPIYDYPRCPAGNPSATVCGSAVIGGPDYQGDTFPGGYRGSMFVGDYTSYKVFRLPPDGNGGYGPPQVFSDSWLGADLEPTPDGNSLAYVNFGFGTGPDGYVGRISYSAVNSAPTVSASADKTSGAAPLTVNFTGSGQDPDGDQLTYDWDFGDGSAHKSTANASHTYTQPGTYQARLTVSDGRGKSASKTISITAGGTAPTVTIAAPTAGYKYRDGDPVQLRGSATDPDQTIPASRLDWQVILHHAEHTHFDSAFPGVGEATFTTRRDHDADSFYEIRLTATDDQGLTNTKSVEIRPETTAARIKSTPTGAPVSYGGRDGTAPFSQTTAIGYSTTVTAGASFTSGGRPFVFERWADDGTANVRNLTVPAAGLDLRAIYIEDKARGMPATGSSTQDGSADFAPSKAVDGDGGTRWSSDRLDDQTWQVDLGRPRSVSQVQVDWEAAYASSYRILTSLDGTNWTAAADQAQAEAGNRVTSFSPRVARHVRILGLQRGTQYGLSFFEARVLGPADDATAPQTTIDSGPSGQIQTTSASFGFSSDEPGSTFECKLDDTGAWGACTSPKALTGLAASSHTFYVRATDPSGNADATPASRSFQVVAPPAPLDTTIATGPSGPIASKSASFTFAGGTSATGYECKLDNGSYTACTSPHALTGLAEGAHTFSVRAHDAAGNPDPTPASRSFSVDTTPPETTISSGPSGDITATSATFGFSSEAGASFECRLDSGAWAACTSPKTFSGLSVAAHSVQVRARDAFGRYDPTPATRSFRVIDRTPPNTTITSSPSGTVTGSSQRFTFSSEAGATFQCRVDSGAWFTCVSPRTVTGLKAGAHSFWVRARDSAGNIDATPARRDFRVAAGSAKLTPSSASYGATVRSTPGLTALYGLGDKDTSARATSTRPGDYHGGPKRVRPLVKRSSDSHARSFDGRNDWSALDPRALGRRKTFSVELWLELAKPGRSRVLGLSGPSGGGLGLDVGATARPRVTARSAQKRSARATGPRLRRGRPHHVVATFDGRRLRLYVDGKLSGSTRYGAGIGPGRGSRLTLGAGPGSSGRFKGTLDELALYDRALSSRQIRAHYGASR